MRPIFPLSKFILNVLTAGIIQTDQTNNSLLTFYLFIFQTQDRKPLARNQLQILKSTNIRVGLNPKWCCVFISKLAQTLQKPFLSKSFNFMSDDALCFLARVQDEADLGKILQAFHQKNQVSFKVTKNVGIFLAISD